MKRERERERERRSEREEAREKERVRALPHGEGQSAAKREKNTVQGFKDVRDENGSRQGQNLAYLRQIFSPAVLLSLPATPPASLPSGASQPAVEGRTFSRGGVVDSRGDVRATTASGNSFDRAPRMHANAGG